jgi:membrane-associated phospholipid phosphatase
MTKFEHLIEVMIKPWVVFICILLMFLTFFYADKSIAYLFHSLNLRINLPILNFIANLGSGVFYIGPMFLLALVFRYVYREKTYEIRTWFLLLSVLVPTIICLILKVSLGRARPDLLFSDNLYGFYGFKFNSSYWSLPSGHTTNIMGFVFGLCALFPRYCYAFIITGLILVSSRILLIHHYFTDVLIASYLALLDMAFLLWYLRRNKLLIYSPKFIAHKV